MKILKASILAITFILVSQSLWAQKDSVNKSNDSINSTLLKQFNKKISEIEQQRKADSVKRENLEAELNSLKNSDRLKKLEIQNKLSELSVEQNKALEDRKARIKELKKTAKSFPVTGFFEDTLFVIYNNLGSFSAKDRAEAISKRIQNITEKSSFTSDSIQLIENENLTDIVIGETIIMSVSNDDALWENSSRKELGVRYRNQIMDAIKLYKSETSLATLAKEIGLALLVIAVIVALIYYISKFFRWNASKIKEQENKRIKGIKIKNYTLFDAHRQVKAMVTANNILKWLFLILLVYLTLPVLFGIFPWTQHFAQNLFGYILNPVKNIASGLLNYLPNLITIIVIIIFFRYVLKGIHFLKTEIANGDLQLQGFYPDWANPTYQIVRILVYAFMIVVIFPYLPGSNSPVFQGVSVFLGFLFTFGSAGSLSNIIAGLILTYMRLFKIGDRVKIGDEVGDVIEKSMLVTRIRTIKNEIISIPNSTVMNSHTINYSSDAPDKGLIIHTTVTIGYDVPWRDMHAALIEAASKTDLILDEPKPFVLQTSLDDFYVSYQINGYIKEPNKQASIYSNLHQNIQDVCNERGIEIMSPHYRAARDGNASTIPASYLPEDYMAPGFTVKLESKEEKTSAGKN